MKLYFLGALKKTAESPPTFAYEPNTPELAQAIDDLVVAYTVYPVRVMELIYRKPMQSFADAFKIRKDPEDG